MNVQGIVVVLAAAAALAALGWFFFGPRKGTAGQLAGGVQRVTVTVRGGYSPELVQVRQGVPLELTFDRQESGDCTSRVVFPDLRVSAALPAYEQTTVRLDPAEAGQFGFACGMNMILGTLAVERSAPVPAASGAQAEGQQAEGQQAEDQQAEDQQAEGQEAVPASTTGTGPGPERTAGLASGAEAAAYPPDAEAAERQAEIRDLARRVIVGAVLTLPVLYTVMSHDVFRTWAPVVLLNHWVQLALITPVMLYA